MVRKSSPTSPAKATISRNTPSSSFAGAASKIFPVSGVDGRRRSRSKYGAKRPKPGQEDAKGKGAKGGKKK